MPIDLNDPEVKAALAEAIEEATQGLAAKNRELLGEVKKLKRGSEIDPAEMTQLETQVDSLKAELAKVNKEYKTTLKAAEDAQKALDAEAGFTKSLLIEQGLTNELVGAGVKNPAHLKAALALLKSGAQVIQDGDSRVARIGDKAIKDFVKEWVSGDEGKHFVTADQNSGGGAGGGSGAGGAGSVKGRIDGSESERAAYFSSKFDFSQA